MDESGSRNGALLSEEAQFGAPPGRASLLGTLEGIRKPLDTDISLHRNSVEEPRGDSLAMTFLEGFEPLSVQTLASCSNTPACSSIREVVAPRIKRKSNLLAIHE
jgi:hypothetical protein